MDEDYASEVHEVRVYHYPDIQDERKSNESETLSISSRTRASGILFTVRLGERICNDGQPDEGRQRKKERKANAMEEKEEAVEGKAEGKDKTSTIASDADLQKNEQRRPKKGGS